MQPWGGPRVHSDTAGCYFAHLYCLLLLCVEAEDPVADVSAHVQSPQLLDQLLWNDSVKGRAEVDEQDPGIGVSTFQVGQNGVECGGDGVLCGTVCLVGKLQWIQVGREAGF